MKKRKYYSILAASLCMLAFCWGCSEETLTGQGSQGEGLVLNLEVDGHPALSATTRAANDPSLNEATVEAVDVFFLKGDAVEKYVRATVTDDGTATLATGTWKDNYRGTYDVYVLANYYGSDDLNSIKTKAELLAQTDVDADICRAEGERLSQSQIYTGKTFLMDGVATAWNADAQPENATINVDLSHAAAKLVVNLSYTDEFLVDGRTIFSVRKKLVHYTQAARTFAEGGTIATVELPVQGEASDDGFSEANVTQGQETPLQRTDKLYAYSYPNEWGSDVAERETYFLVNVLYSDNGGDVVNNYYKVPVRVSGNTADLVLERNKEYTVNVTIDRLGNESIDEPETLTPTFSVAKWETENINVDSNMPNYLVVSENYIELHNEADTVVTFFSSNYINVEVTDAYFINKDGEEVRTEGSGWNPQDLVDMVTVTYNEQALTGEIKINSPVPDNVTARYITLRVTNDDNSTPQEITIVQYPLEYITGVEGKYATRDDYEGNTYEAYRDGTRFENRVEVSSSFGSSDYYGSYTFYSKVYEESRYGGDGTIYQVNCSGFRYYTLERGSENAPGQNNNRMYLVQITSTSDAHTVARPATEMENGQLVTVSDSENNQLVSPSFMLASQLGVITSQYGGGSWSGARDHCKYYVEYVEYDDGTVRKLDDWRLPTEAELAIIAGYQTEQPDVMDKVLAGRRYWTALSNTYYTVPSGTTDATGVRCIRDVTPEDLEEFRAHGIK